MLLSRFINFMLSEEPAIANATYIGYASPNKLVRNLVFDDVPDEYTDALLEYTPDAIEILYGKTPEEVNEDYAFNPCYKSFSPEIQDYTNTLWESLKTENSTEFWVHITTVVIVAAVLSLAIYNIVIEKIRSKDYRLRDKKKRQAAKQKQ